MNWTFFHKLGSPKWFYDISGKWLPWLQVSSLVLILVALVWGLAFTPPDYLQGNSYRIIFIHVPASFLAQAVYMMMATAAAVTLIWKIKLADMALKVMAPIGASFCILSLATGAIWGQPTWGTWWVWDARLTSELILLFLYLGFIALQSATDDVRRADRAGAILVLVGVVNIPIIYYSVEWWNTLHQGASVTVTGKSSMGSVMLTTMLIMTVAFWAYTFAVVYKRVRNIMLEREKDTQWVSNLPEVQAMNVRNPNG